MTKIEWLATRQRHDNLADVTDMDHGAFLSGYSYRDGCDHIEERGERFGVIIGNTEAEFTTLSEAEDYLWTEWAAGECNG